MKKFAQNEKGMTWREIKKVFPQVEKMYKDFEKAFRDLGKDIAKDKLSIEDINILLSGDPERFKGKYEISYSPYTLQAQKLRDEANEIMMKINRTNSIEQVLGRDPKLVKAINLIASASAESHGVDLETVGWFRLDKISKTDEGEWILLVDEIQTDILKVLYEMAKGKGKFAGMKDRLIELYPDEYRDYNFEGAYKFAVDVIGDWHREGIATILDMARNSGIKYVAIHTEESTYAKGEGASYVRSLYGDPAKSLGFTEMILDVDGKRLPFFVREAHVDDDSFLIDVIEDLVIKEGYCIDDVFSVIEEIL